MHEVLLLIKLLQTKRDVKSMSIIYFDLYYTINKNGVEKEEEEIDKYDITIKYFYDNIILPNYDI